MMVRRDPHDVEAIVTIPGSRSTKSKGKDKEDPGVDVAATGEKNGEGEGADVGEEAGVNGDVEGDGGEGSDGGLVDRDVWIYEQLR
jgi:hypothetical protein